MLYLLNTVESLKVYFQIKGMILTFSIKYVRKLPIRVVTLRNARIVLSLFIGGNGGRGLRILLIAAKSSTPT